MTGKVLQPPDIKTFHRFGGRRAVFNAEEIAQLKSFGAPGAHAFRSLAAAVRVRRALCGAGLVLVGFKPRAELLELYNLRSPYFVYPNEVPARSLARGAFLAEGRGRAQSEVTGSTVAFRALHAKMRELVVIGIARMVLKAGSTPRFVALVPSVRRDAHPSHTRAPARLTSCRCPMRT